MKRRRLLALGVLALADMRIAWAQARMARIGFLWTSNPEPAYLEAFRAGLRELGYTEGSNLLLEHRSAANVVQTLDSLVRELVNKSVDIIVTQGTPAARAASRATRSIPIVIALGEPLGARLVQSLRNPGGNVTGLTVLSVELSSKRLELLKQVNPKISRVAILFDATATDPEGNPLAGPSVQEKAARDLGLQIHPVPVRAAGELPAAFAAASDARADAIVLNPSPVLSFHNKPLVELAAKHRLPAMYGNPEAVTLGGLMSYGPSYTALFRRAATYVDKILKGAKPSDLPLEQPTKFEFAINLKTANALGLAIPQAVLLRADEVIQ